MTIDVTVKRFDLSDEALDELSKGEFVYYTDYQKLEAENEQLVYEARSLRLMIDDMAARYGQQSLDNLMSISYLARTK